MSDTTTFLEQTRLSRGRYRTLGSEASHMAAAGLSLVPQSFMWGRDAADFREWEGGFRSKFEALSDRVASDREALAEEYEALMEDLGHEGYEQAAADPEFAQAIGRARSYGVKARWDYEAFFAEEGGEGARRSLTYVDDGGHDVLYDDDQFQALLSGERAQAGGRTLHGHHINDVSTGLKGDLTSIDHLHDPENVRLMTAHSHLHDEARGHGGSFRNSTTGEADDVTQKYDAVVGGNKEVMVDEQAVMRQEALVLGAALAAGSIAAIIEVRKLRNDPRPWKNKAAAVACTFALRASEGGTISFASLAARDAVATSPTAEFAAASIAEVAGQLGLDLGAESIENLLGGAVGLEVVVVVRLGVGAARDIMQGRSLGDVARDHGRTALVASGENLAFLLLGVGLDVVVPDPTGVVIAARVVYSMGKTAYNYKANVESKAECLRCRMGHEYDLATGELSSVPEPVVAVR